MATKTVYVELVAQTKKLTDGLKKADRQIGRTTQGLKKMVGALAGVFAARKIAQVVKGTILDADELIKMARATGLSATEYERLAFVLKKLGATPTTLKQGLGDLQLRLGDVGKLYDKFFRQIGLDPDKLRNTSPAQQIELVLSALTKVENQAQRAAIAGRVLGEESSRQLLKVINAGATAIEDAAHGFIPSLAGKEQEDQIEAMVDATTDLAQAWKAFKTQVILSAGPEAMGKLIDQMSKLGEMVGGAVKNQDTLKLAWVGMGTAAVAALAAIAAALGPVGVAVAAIAAGITTIAVYWDDLGDAIKLVWMDMNKGVERFATAISGSANPFMESRAGGPPVPLTPRALTPFDKGIQQHIRQDVTVMAQGITWEQVKAAVRSEGGVAAKGGLR